ncbi:polyribonucleotide nucleotidyltransferase [Oscillospiraceae bacterium HV4-5-C5C]|nr:polyribonucleotide nucleotidyltransferase [Oscillospiraceae bacterium HV4-5-C5C]
MKQVFSMDLAGRPLTVEVGQLALFANGSCLVHYGDTVVLSTATASKQPRPGIDFFPLSVDYEEKMYSVGRFPGGFLKREGRPTEKAILTCRAIDRPMRPLFPKDLRNDVNINNLVMSVDPDCSPEIAAMIGSSIAVSISDIPWNGPTASLSIGLVGHDVVINPTEAQRQESRLDLTLAGTEAKVCMIEAGAQEVPDEEMLEAIIAGHKVIQEVCRFIKDIQAQVGKAKFSYPSAKLPKEMLALVLDTSWDRMREAVLTKNKEIRDARVQELTAAVEETVAATNEDWMPFINEAIYQVEKKVVRDYLFREHRRVDGRAMDEIRPLSCEVGLLPRVHGSALFQRGQTQVLTSCTLAPMSKVQVLDGLDNDESKRYIHQYNFPGYSTGEAKSTRSPGRREIGHGALAERSLLAVLPSVDEFPYAIRNVSEVLMSNGSTSQASVCASTLALMDAGVPITRPVAGISSGLITDPDNDHNYTVFMDIQGIEDFFGDMDFKVAGTTEGITGIQVDIKVDGLSYDIIRDAFAMTRKGRLQIINEVIKPCLEAPREHLSAFAPKIYTLTINPDKISEVIGKGGKVINKIIDQTGAEIDIEDDGHVYVSCTDEQKAQQAMSIIKGIATDPVPGQVYAGQVTRLMTFGAFVEYLPGKEGLVHISKIDWNRVEKVEDALQVGDAVTVKITDIDDQGRVNLSIRDCLPKPEGWVEPQPVERGDRGADRGPRSGRPHSGMTRGHNENRERFDRGPRERRGGFDRGPRDNNNSEGGGHFRD